MLLYNSPFVVPMHIVPPFPLDVVLSLSNSSYKYTLQVQNSDRIHNLFPGPSSEWDSPVGPCTDAEHAVRGTGGLALNSLAVQ